MTPFHGSADERDRDLEDEADRRRGIFRRMDLIHDGRRFLARRGIDARLCGLYLHLIGVDPGRDLHDHPWAFLSVVLWGGYTEHRADARDAPMLASLAEQFPETCGHGRELTWRAGSVHRVRLTEAHRIVSCRPRTVTLVIRGRKSRSWGFYPPYGFEDFRHYDYATRRPVEVRGHDG